MDFFFVGRHIGLFFIFWMKPVEAPFDFICTGDSGFEQSIHHFAGGDDCVGKGWTV
jgi:hypothetical protein